MADVGCGLGASTRILAETYPASTVRGFDSHPESIELARKAAAEAGLADRCDFAVARAQDFPGSGYGLVATFDCLHDMGDPVGAARHIRSALADDGVWLIVEPYAGESIAENLNPVGRLYYSFSTFLCVPHAISEGADDALGNQAGEAPIAAVVRRPGSARSAGRPRHRSTSSTKRGRDDGSAPPRRAGRGGHRRLVRARRPVRDRAARRGRRGGAHRPPRGPAAAAGRHHRRDRPDRRHRPVSPGRTPALRPPGEDEMAGILLVHGAWHGTWCWERFAERLAAAGHDVRTARLRGHDGDQYGPKPAGSPRRIWYRVRDYVQDVTEATSRFPEPPVVVGHSLGGLVVAKYLERGRSGGAVLLAPIPQAGSLGAIIRLASRHPLVIARANLTLRLRPFVTDPTLVRELFFTAETPRPLVEDVWRRLQDESYLAFLDTLMVRAQPGRIRVPVLIMGAEHDRFFTAAELRRTAAAYGIQAEMVAGIGHDMMLDRGWQQVADRIDTWIRDSVVIRPDVLRGG